MNFNKNKLKQILYLIYKRGGKSEALYFSTYKRVMSQESVKSTKSCIGYYKFNACVCFTSEVISILIPDAYIKLIMSVNLV